MTRERILSLLKTDIGRVSLEVLDEAVSTNDTVIGMKNSDSLCVAIAVRQTGGRGRLGRSFASPKGGLYISFKKALAGDIEDVFSIMPLAALCVCDTVEALCRVKCEIKWPNDVLVGGKKICGILAQAHIKGDARYLILGIGINFNGELPKELTAAASLKDVTGEKTDLDRAAAFLIDSVARLLSTTSYGSSALMEGYRQRCVNIGRKVTVTYGGCRVDGVVTGISEIGGLMIVSDSGERIIITSGEATLRD